jgi:hypothetical protein
MASSLFLCCVCFIEKKKKKKKKKKNPSCGYLLLGEWLNHNCRVQIARGKCGFIV